MVRLIGGVLFVAGTAGAYYLQASEAMFVVCLLVAVTGALLALGQRGEKTQ